MKLSNLLRKAQSVKQKLEHPYTAAVIVAAGSATRMGGVDKIFAPIAKLPVICRTLAAFNNHPAIDEIIVVTRPDVIERMSRVCVAYEKVHIVVSGGASRTESVQKGLAGRGHHEGRCKGRQIRRGRPGHPGQGHDQGI